VKAKLEEAEQTIADLREIEKKYYELLKGCEVLPAKLNEKVYQRDTECEHQVDYEISENANCSDIQKDNKNDNENYTQKDNENDNENEEDLRPLLLMWVNKLSERQYTLEEEPDLEKILYSCYYNFVGDETEELALKLIGLVKKHHTGKGCLGEQLVFKNRDKNRFDILKYFCECYESRDVMPESEVEEIFNEYLKNLSEYPLELKDSIVFDGLHPQYAYIERALTSIIEKKNKKSADSEWKGDEKIRRVHPYAMSDITLWDVFPQE